jgi:hypothetical protein
MTKTKKIVTGAVAAVALAFAGLSIAGSTPAEAGHKHHWHGKYFFYSPYVVAPYAFYQPHGCFWKWTKWGSKVYVCY